MQHTEQRFAKGLAVATLVGLFFLGNVGGAFGAFWRANFPDFTDSDDVSDFEFGYGYGSLGWGYGYGYGYGYAGYDQDGIGYYASASGSLSGSGAFLDPVAVTPSQIASVVVAQGGNPASTTGVTVAQAVQIAATASARVTLPQGVEISLAGGGAFNTANLTVTDTSSSTSVTGFNTVRGAVSFGTGGGSFRFSKPIKIEIPTPALADGVVAVRVDHGTGFTTTGLAGSPDASCVDGAALPSASTATVVSGVATIYTCSASTFAAVQSPNADSTTTVSTGGSGGGGGGSGGSSSLKKDSCPAGDYSPSYYDSKCGVAPDQGDILDNNTDLSPTKTNITEAVTTAVELVGTMQLSPTANADGTKQFVLTSGRGEIVLKTNSNAELSLTIPSNTLVTSSSAWDGRLQAPLQIRNADTEARGIMVIFAGNKDTSLSFSQPLTFTVPVAYENGTKIEIYTAPTSTGSLVSHGQTTVQGGRVVFTTNHLSYYVLKPSATTTSPASPSFPDISDSFAREYIEQLFSMGVINGFNDGTFRPEATATRAEFLKMALKGLEVSYDSGLSTTSFSDVNVDWQLPIVEAARRMGIVNGQNVNGQLVFRPNDSITRAEAMKILMRASGLETGNFSSRLFTDISDEWQYEFVESARAYGIVNGQNVNGQLVFRPNDSITRAEVAKVVVLTGRKAQELEATPVSLR